MPSPSRGLDSHSARIRTESGQIGLCVALPFTGCAQGATKPNSYCAGGIKTLGRTVPKLGERHRPRFYSREYMLVNVFRKAVCDRFSMHRSLASGLGHCLDRDSGHRGPIIEIDVRHVVMRVVIAHPIDVVVLHEQHGGNAGVGEYLAVGVVERTAGIVRRTDLAVQ